ncbi:YMGG-like glycine zipper-containing protein [Acidisoma sp. C75]
MRLAIITMAGLGGLCLLAGCTDPYSPGQRALGGAAIGAGSGALIGGLAGGGQGAGIGALVGGAVGAAAGAATTPQRPYYQQPYGGGYYYR